MPVIFLWNSQTRRSTPSDLATTWGEQSFHIPPSTKYCAIKYHLSKPQTSKPTRRPNKHIEQNKRPRVHLKKWAQTLAVIRVWKESKCTQCTQSAFTPMLLLALLVGAFDHPISALLWKLHSNTQTSMQVSVLSPSLSTSICTHIRRTRETPDHAESKTVLSSTWAQFFLCFSRLLQIPT